MANQPGPKKYGLLTKINEPPRFSQVAAVFGDSDDDDGKIDFSGKNKSASSIRVQKEAERTQQIAMAQDPLIFDYDANYDKIQQKREEKTAANKIKDKNKEAKYAPTIIQAHKVRVLEEKSREERQQQREREKEKGEFDGKEVFITSAYRAQMEEVQKYREEEAYKNRIDEATSIDKQMIWQSGFSRTMLDTIARGSYEGLAKEDEGKAELKPSVEFKARKTKNLRRREESSDNEEAEKTIKKSIYDSENELDADQIVHKNFVGDLKPGLNKPAVRPKERVMTKAERLRRQFTPSDNEEDRDRHSEDSKSGHGRRRRANSHSPRNTDEKSKENKEASRRKPTALSNTKEAKIERLKNLKEILQQRNGPREIEEARQRFLDRRATGVVTLPV